MDINLSELNALGEEEVKRLLLEEGRRLEKIAKDIWRKYYESYKPRVYKRTYRSLEAIQLNPSIEKLSPTEWGIRLNFVDDLAYHPSIIRRKDGKVYPHGHAIMLISSGWRVKRGWHKDKYRFGYFEGINYIDKVIEEFNKNKSPYIQIEFNWNGAYLR